MDGQMFERRYVELALEIAKSLGMTQLDFTRAVWPNKSDASGTTTIIALKRQNSRGKPQNLRVADAISMARAIGREYPSLCFEVWEKMKCEASSLSPLAARRPIEGPSLAFLQEDQK